VLKLRDLVLFNLVAVLGLRHVAAAATYGPSSLVIWLIAAIFFFVPQGLAVIELSSRFPQEGGIYSWTKRALGEGHGFLCGWCYWINNIFYYPSLLISTAVIATYIFGKENIGLDKNWTYVLTVTLVSLWLAVILNIVGVGTGKWLQNAGGIGTYVPGVMLILVGVYAVFTQAPANAITLASLKPNLSDFSANNPLAIIAFAFAGLELSATMGDEIKNPRRNLPRSVYIAAPLIVLAYIAGTCAVLWLVPNMEGQKINAVTGFLDALRTGSSQLSSALWWIVPLAAALYTISNLGGMGAWLSGPARVAFVVGLDRYFPPAFGRVHPRWRTPYIAIMVPAVLATVFLLFLVPSNLEEAYFSLLATQVLVAFIPYIYLFICFFIHRKRAETTANVTLAPGGRIGALALGLSGLLITIFAMIMAMIPPPGTPDPGVFVAKVIGGAAGFILLGGIIYWRAKWSRRNARKADQ
jgi:glutamate:GABA antiporter